ncbi:MAG: hypothetical protein LBL75_02030 [Rickettsiales bacterium]|jgi:hypothetical protein|nr:hypothetical protein [Rickettsiales bacterium]
MKKFLMFCGILFAPLMASASEFDIENPLYFENANDFVVIGGGSYGSDLLDVGLNARYGINGIFSLAADVKYQQDFDGNADGFSDVGFQLTYRASSENIITDILAGINFGGSSAPEWYNNVYSAGIRVGKNFNKWTFAGTGMASWIFDDVHGMSFIDLSPSVYYSFNDEWKIGGDIIIRRATMPRYNRETFSLKIVRQYGRTQYTGFGQYEIEESDFRFGARVGVVF